MIFGPSDIGNGNTARTCENGDFNKNMNIADSNVDNKVFTLFCPFKRPLGSRPYLQRNS
jgi:hypothetical protein